MGDQTVDELLSEMGYTDNLTAENKKAVADKKKADEKKKNVKNLVEDGMSQGKDGLGKHTRKILQDIDSPTSSYKPPADVGKPKNATGGSTR